MTNPTARKRGRTPQLPLLLQQAVSAHEAGQHEAAETQYRKFLTQHPEHPTALQLLGLLHLQRGECDPAIALMQASLKAFPEQPEVANNLGNAFSRCGRRAEAVESYSRAIRLSPRYADAWRNLALCYLDANIPEDAEKCFRRCLHIVPRDAAAWLGLGNVHKRREEFDSALRCYEKALELRPDYAEAHHNLGVCLRIVQRPADALKHYATARSLGLDRAELHHNMGSALVDVHDVGAAIESYRQALRRNPEDTISHRDLNKLLWEQELLDEYLASYREALEKFPHSAALRLDYAVALNRQDAFEEAERVLMQGLRHRPDSGALKSQLAYTMEGQQRWRDALQLHAAAVTMPDSVPDHRISYARALLVCRRPDEALEQAREAARQTPFDQRALAYLGLCWRMLGDERDATLNDYENFARVYEVPVPPEFAGTWEFNRRLGEVLEGLHIGKRHPPEQTLRGGTQTHGDLFQRREPEILSLVAGLKQCVQDYIERMPDSSEHPLFARKSSKYHFAGAWSVRLRRSGYHTMHVHPMGWISSAYYVQVPREISESDAAGGGIKFGEPDIDLGPQGAARREIRPIAGRLVLFPSYMWHGTIPFESDEPRMTVAFDVVPTPAGTRRA